MLDGESEIIAVTAEIEVAVAPGMELGRAAQSLAVAEAAGALLGVVDDNDGELMLALEVAQKGEQGSDLGGRVFIAAMQADEGVEDEQARPESGDGVFEAEAVGGQIEAHGGGGDDLEVEVAERDASGGADAVEAETDDLEGVLSGVEQDATWGGHGEAAQARGAGCDGDGEVKSQERLAGFGLASDDAHRLLGPETGDQPSVLLGADGEAMGGDDGEEVHRQRPAPSASEGGAAKVSRNRFSSRRSRSRCAATASSSPAMLNRAR